MSLLQRVMCLSVMCLSLVTRAHECDRLESLKLALHLLRLLRLATSHYAVTSSKQLQH